MDLAAEMLRVQAARREHARHPYPAGHGVAEGVRGRVPLRGDRRPARGHRRDQEGHDRDQPDGPAASAATSGYGKTEMAIRAAFKAVEFGKQVAMLVPTTVLAEQHYRTFKERIADYPFTIECRQPLQDRRRSEGDAERCGKGQVDIIIGTHRIISART